MAIPMVGLEAERDALRRALAHAQQQVYDKGAALDEADKWRDRFMHQISELEAERDALLERLNAAEGCAVALNTLTRFWSIAADEEDAPEWEPKRFDWGDVMDRYWDLVQAQLDQALAAWRAADGG